MGQSIISDAKYKRPRSKAARALILRAINALRERVWPPETSSQYSALSTFYMKRCMYCESALVSQICRPMKTLRVWYLETNL